ncbi:class I SAM-dependent methyltransferase [Algisphaera agarilytica]|uniref:SAM-dependent methyltransferase n=1 Tax=Algisphaera agarilytica TaxID=1385975 RepID=A0A7X0H702_9BACT|nr:class I SAM-dependent methyltransferase [Algisphaera agarilytica]MBB6428994.1 SAM-dependent methyltransferase [Algisphaera agarilytica]
MPDSRKQYWDDRAARLGTRAVLHIKHPPEAIDEVTHKHFYEVFDRVDPLLTGQEVTALDFGCGAGRLTPLLTQRVSGRVLGVDPTRELIDLAQGSGRVKFTHLTDHTLPTPDFSIDLLFVFGVLGGIPDDELPATLGELNRVLRPDGILVLIENTTDAPDAPHWFFRSVEDHLTMFPEIDLEHLGGYEEFGETMSIFAGRPHPPAGLVATPTPEDPAP